MKEPGAHQATNHERIQTEISDGPGIWRAIGYIRDPVSI
jgi:hypothetical protein